MNKVILIGRFTKDVESKVSANGKSVARFTLACQRKYKNAEGNYDADFINCVAFGSTADFISNYFSKGSSICVIGTLQNRVYEVNGEKKYATDVNITEAEFVGSNSNSSDKKTVEDTVVDLFGEEINDADMPF